MANANATPKTVYIIFKPSHRLSVTAGIIIYVRITLYDIPVDPYRHITGLARINKQYIIIPDNNIYDSDKGSSSRRVKGI